MTVETIVPNKVVEVDTWDIVERSSGYWLVGPNDPIGPFDSVEGANDARIVDFDDIEGCVEPDDWSSEPPWEACDGWGHEFHRERWNEREEMHDSYGWVNRSTRDGGSGWIEVTDNEVIGWGCDGYPGCSKQVRFEAIARAKRKATEQLVQWYCNGWYIWLACAKHDDYSDYLGGIWDDDYSSDYVEECILECRRNVAGQMEDDGYIVEGKPRPANPYNRIDSFRDRIRRNLDCSS